MSRRSAYHCISGGIPPCPICPVHLHCHHGREVVLEFKKSVRSVIADERPVKPGKGIKYKGRLAV